MAEIVQETISTQGNTVTPVVSTTTKSISAKSEASQSQTIEYVIYYFFGALEILLSFRLVLKLMGASITSSFVGLIYGVTGLFVLPFEGIFRRAVSQGMETASILEPSTIVALIVYAFVAWGIVKLVHIFSGEQQTKTV